MARGLALRRALTERRFKQVLRYLRREYTYHRSYCLSDHTRRPWKYTRRISITETETVEVHTVEDYEIYLKASARKRRDNAAHWNGGWGGNPRYCSYNRGLAQLTVQERIALTRFPTNIHANFDQ